MNQILILKGLPGSGKSTFAREMLKQQPGKWKIIANDGLRLMLDDGEWTPKNEKFLHKTRDALISLALENNYNVILDATYLNPIHERHIRELFTTQATIEIRDFTDVPLETCIKRDLERTGKAKVGEKVIRQMHLQYLYKSPSLVEPISGLPNVVLCDLDGTLCLFGDKNPYDRDFENDTINKAVKHILDRNDPLNEIIFISGRSDKFRQVTQEWLNRYDFNARPLLMRQEGDRRKDTVVKEEFYHKHIKDKYNVLYVLDDRLQVCRLWHTLGLPVLRVGDPDADF